MEKIRKLNIYLLCLWTFLLPWQTRYLWRLGEINGGYWEYGTISIYGTDIILFLFLIISALTLKTENINRQPKNIWYGLACVVMVSFIGLFWSPDFYLAFYKYILLLAGIGLFYFVSLNIVKRDWLINSFLFGLVGSAILAIWQFFSQSSFSNKWLGLAYQSADRLGAAVIETGDGGRWLRAYGSFDHPNILGAIMAVGIIIMVWKIGETQTTTNKNKYILYWAKLFFLIILATACFISFSKTAFIGLFIGLLILILFTWREHNTDKSKRIIISSIFLLVVFVTLTIINRDFIFSRMSGGRLEEKSQNERITGYGEAYKLAKLNYGRGTGIGNYGIALARNVKQGEQSYYYQPAHNVFVMVISELGVVGYIAWLGFLVLLFVYIWRQRYALGLAIVSMMLVMFLFDHWWWSLHIGNILMWFLLGLSVLIERKSEKV